MHYAIKTHSLDVNLARVQPFTVVVCNFTWLIARAGVVVC
jgi:hypothetical protein